MEESVILILDPNFANKLKDVSFDHIVWICDTPANRVAAVELRKSREKRNFGQNSVTTFTYTKELDKFDLLDLIATIGEHHDWLTLEVYGMKPDDQIKSALISEFNVARIEVNEWGFKITRV